MGWRHRLTSKDAAQLRGVCAICGPVALAKKGTGVACKVARHSHERNKAGLTKAEAAAVLRKCCDVCQSTRNLVIDHDHTTGEIRGTLCKRCNSALGWLGDSRERIVALLKYLDGCGPPH